MYIYIRYLVGMAAVIYFGVVISRYIPKSWIIYNTPEPSKTEQGQPDDSLKPQATETEQRKPVDHPKFEVPEARENGQEARELRNSLLTGAQLIRTYRGDVREIERLEVALELAHEEQNADNIRKFEKSLGDAVARKRLTFGMYQQELRQVQQAYTMKQLHAELPVLENELAVAGDRTALSQFAGLFVSQAEGSRQPSGTDEGTISQQLIELEVK